MDSLYVPLILALLGLVFGGLSAVRLGRLRRLQRTGSTAVGVVVGQRDGFTPGGSAAGGSAMTQSPVVRFTTATGELVEVTPAVRTSSSSFIPGRPVMVHYDPARPGSAVIAGYEAGIYRLLLCVGIVLLAVATALTVVPRDTWEPVLDVFPALIPVAIGLLFGSIGLFGIRRVARLQRTGIEASGVVVGETTSSSDNGLTLHHPVVRYSLPDGHPVDVPTYRGTVAVRARPGDHVIVRYDAADPGRMLLRGDGVQPIFVIFTLVGLVVFAVGVAITYHLLT